MNDDQTAQSSSSPKGDATIQQQNQQTVQGHPQPSSPPVQPITPAPQQPTIAPHHKEQAPVAEHIHVTDPMESQPELHQELKEHGVEVKTDEAHLEIAREQQEFVQHSPQSQKVSPVVQEEQKPEFPLTYVQAETVEKKTSVLDSVRWLATFVLRQMKMKKIAEEVK